MLKVGLIGAGTMGSVHADAYTQVKGAKLAGIVGDARKPSVTALAQRHGVSVYSTVEELVSVENPDMLDICLPTFLHKEYVLKAAALGKHVFCEKPIAATAADAREMIEACERAGVKLMIGHVLRFEPDYIKAKQLVDRDAVGRVGTIRAIREGGMPQGSRNWYNQFSASGGVILDLIIHDFDWIRWTFGEVERVYAKSIMGREALPMDHAFVSLRLKNGAIAHVSGSWAQPEGFRTFLELAGTKGVTKIEYDEASMPIRTMVRGGQGGVIRSSESPIGISPYAAELQHFVDCITTDGEPSITGHDALKALEISLAALESVRTGRAVTL
jgi:UDP-N-acetylglucosamine 3-dehydrogenase